MRRERRGAQGQLAAREVPRRAKAPPATADVVHRHLQTERSETPVQTLQVGIVSRAHGVWPRGQLRTLSSRSTPDLAEPRS